MDSTKKHVKVSPEERASILSKLCFWWVIPFFKFGYTHDIQFSDIWNSTNKDLSAPLADKLEKNWKNEIRKAEKFNRKPKLKIAIFKTFFKSYLRPGFLLGFQWIFLKLFLPILLAAYIKSFKRNVNTADEWKGWALAFGLLTISILAVIITHKTNLELYRVAMRARVAVCSLIYRKLLRLNHTSLGATNAGQLVNFLSNDVQRLDTASQFLHFSWILPFNAIISTYILWYYVGIWATVVSMTFICIQSIPVQGAIAKYQGKMRQKIALRTDARIKLMNEITSGIQVIKMYAWESPFEKVVELYRKLEIELVTKTSYCLGILSSMQVFTERVVLYLTIVTYVGTGNIISGDIVYAIAQLFSTIQNVMSFYFPSCLTTYREAIISINRIEKFLLLEEKKTYQITSCKNFENVGKIELESTASWKKDSIVPTLINLNLNVRPGTLCCVVGLVGAGKSSLLQLLLKELPEIDGKVDIYGNISYASQEPWLFASNVRQNILFGKPYFKQRYKEVIRVCSLEKDFQQFPYGDKTLVGEKGTSLSGGQRARVNLARAVYNEADIYLLDDPLSAVDTTVGRHLFDECIVKFLQGKTRILVTHQLQFLKDANLIVIVNDGKIEKVGTFEEMSETLNTIEQNVGENNEIKKDIINETIVGLQEINFRSFQSIESLKQDEEPTESDDLIAKGTIPNSTYWEYFNSGNSRSFLVFTIFMFIFAQVITNASDLWLSNWTNIEPMRSSQDANKKSYTVISSFLNTSDITNSTEDSTHETLLKTINILYLDALQRSTKEDGMTSSSIIKINLRNDMLPTLFYMLGYTALIIASVIFLIWRSILYYRVCMTSSKVLHNKMFHNVLLAPMRFFDTNPSGRILNRFSKDMGAIDELLPRTQLYSIQIFVLMFGILGMVFYTSPWMVIPTLFLAPLFYFSRVIYLSSAQAIKRLEGSSKAPVFSHVTASLYGISTIRASQAEQMLIDEFDVLQDQHTSTFFLYLAVSECYGFYLDFMSTLFLAFVIFQYLIFKNENTLSGSVGLAISHSIILTETLQYGIRQTAEVASSMVSVERVLQYTKLEKERPFETLPERKPAKKWPSAGKITFKNTYLRYDLELPPILKNLNVEFQSGEKVGIVGRTGAGKSTLLTSLFRLAPIEGTITIDGIDTAEVGLTALRLKISIIPQNPVLFCASVRYNLDPFETESDETLWRALKHVELEELIKDLNQQVTEGGANFSAGQRQLLCLARAIVRNNKILVMDEATANLDPLTDSLIQKTIREKFKECTVLTIAHRLNTIIDSDRVLVMEAGEAVEFDHPYILLQDSTGYFYKMVKETGAAMEKSLTKAAKDNYVLKKGTDQVIKTVFEDY